jgi:hypothetical protein
MSDLAQLVAFTEVIGEGPRDELLACLLTAYRPPGLFDRDELEQLRLWRAHDALGGVVMAINRGLRPGGEAELLGSVRDYVDRLPLEL